MRTVARGLAIGTLVVGAAGKDASCCACTKGSDQGSDLVSFHDVAGKDCDACCASAKYESGKDESDGTCKTRLSASKSCAPGVEPEYIREFEKFMKAYNKNYSGEDEKMKRFNAFKANYDIIKQQNALLATKYKLGLNDFADQGPEEFASTHYGYKKPEKLWGDAKHLGTHVYQGEPLADSLDWVTKGAVTKVKNQGQCGSCWSFSTTGGLEGAWEIATGKLVSLSEEMLVDCSKKNDACNGGSMDSAFQYVETNGLCTEASYPYTSGGGTVGTCKASTCAKALVPGAVTGFHDVSPTTASLKSALNLGPVSIAVEADKSTFQLYKTGVMTGNCGTKLDHGILAVGYGVESGTEYWMVKNSWGTVWGEQGYGKLEAGKGGAGECGILSGATYPKVTKSPPPAPAPTPPGPTPPAPAPNASPHYEKPPCQSGELAVQIQGVTGSFCSAKCTDSACPTDTPAGTTDTPSCCLSTSTGDKYCAIECTTAGCPTGASCQKPPGSSMGICVYPAADLTEPCDDLCSTEVVYSGPQEVITV